MLSRPLVIRALVHLTVAACVLAIPAPSLAQDTGAVVDMDNNRVVFFDLGTHTIIGSVDTGGVRPMGMAITPDGRTLIVANTTSNSLSLIDLTTPFPALLQTVPIDSPCIVLGATPTADSRFVVTTHAFCAAPAKVTSIDLSTRTVLSQMQVGGGEAFDIAITRDGRKIIGTTFGSFWTANLSDAGVLSGPQQYINAMGQSSLNTMVMTPNGRLALATASTSVSVLAIDAASNVTHTGTVIPTGSFPRGLEVAPDGAHAYVLNQGDSSMAVLSIDAEDRVADTGIRVPLPGTLSATIGVRGIAITNDSRRAYVSDVSGSVMVVDLQSNSFSGTRIPTGGRALEIVLFSRNQPPTADAGADRTVECAGHGGTRVILDASASSDPDADTLSFEWTNAGGAVIGSSALSPIDLPQGTHTFTLTVTDDDGATSSDSVTITVRDTTPPAIANAMASPAILWPADGRLIPVAVTVDFADVCDANASCRIVNVAVSDPSNARGDGNRTPDWKITGELTALLRAERSGGGSGRTYTLTIECLDASGNAARRDVPVLVPHDRR